MDISNAITEPFSQYHEFHEDLNKKVKILTASLAHTLSYLSVEGNEREIINLIKAASGSWNTSPVASLSEYSKSEIYNYVSEFSIISSFSAFDDCISGMSAEIDRWSAFEGLEVEANEKSDVSPKNKVTRLYGSFGWSADGIESLLPIYEYFQSIRNCIAHRSGKTSQELESISHSESLANTVSNMFPVGKPLPVLNEGDLILLEPNTTLLCSHILRLICEDMNSHLAQYLGERGLMYMICYHAFFKSRIEKTAAKTTAERVLRTILVHRYKITYEDKRHPVSLAAKLGLWKRCLECYDEKYTNS